MDVQVGATSFRVDVRRDGHDWVVSLDGRTCRVNAQRVAGGWSLLVGPDAGVPSAARRSYDVAFDSGIDGLRVHVDGVAVPVSLPEERRRVRRRAGGTVAGAGRQNVVAPMPGRVVKVLVATGDAVVDRQPVAVLEAMKMQNEIAAPSAGVVSGIHVAPGQAVGTGAKLVTLAVA